MKKILVVRFSSIGDVVLTTPVVRCLHEQLPDTEIHYLTKESFGILLLNNPNIEKLITIQKSIQEKIHDLREEKYDCIIDLHHNLRTKVLKWKLQIPMYSFPKLNFQKWLYVQFKKDTLPDMHVVDRYFSAVKTLGIVPDKKLAELYIPETDQLKLSDLTSSTRVVAIAIGAQFATKRLPTGKLLEIVNFIPVPVILMGGSTDIQTAEFICKHTSHKEVINACGKYNLLQSASIVSQVSSLISHDTGLMHIAACFDTPIVSIWGNTTPRLGMYPYKPMDNIQESFSIHQVDSLSCRPCSKIGFKKCPKSHFHCMEKQNIATIVSDVIKRIS